MKSPLAQRFLLAAILLLTLTGLPGAAQARPGNPGDSPPPARGPRNVAFGKPVFLSTNGADAPAPNPAFTRLDPPALTDGSLQPRPPTAGGPPGILVFFNPTPGRPLAITVTMDLQGSYNVTRIRFNPGVGQGSAQPDTIGTPLGGSTAAPDAAGWTVYDGSLVADTITLYFSKTAPVDGPTQVALGEIEVYGVPTPPAETLKMPFDPGQEWRITQGYHGDTSHNQWERAYVCGQDYLAFDLARVDFHTSDDRVRAPAGGRVWVIWPALGAVMIRHDWASGVYFSLFYHMNPINPDLRLGQWVSQGAVLGRPGDQGLTPGAGVHIHWSFYRAPNPNLIPVAQEGARTPNWCRDSVHWVESVPFLHVEAAGRGMLDFTDDPNFPEPCRCEGMYAEKHYFSTQYEIGQVPALAPVPGLVVPSPGPEPTPIAAGALAFPATGHILAAPFRDYWDAHGGAEVLGAPVSEAYWDRDATGLYQVQAFERAYVRRYPWRAGGAGGWSLDRLGAQIYGGYHRPDGWQPVAAFSTTERQQFFPETGHGIYGAFYRYWQRTGGLAGSGYPLSEPFSEANPLTGATYLTQYFERARLEYHPQAQGTPAEIYPNRLGLLGLIGRGWVAP